MSNLKFDFSPEQLADLKKQPERQQFDFTPEQLAELKTQQQPQEQGFLGKAGSMAKDFAMSPIRFGGGVAEGLLNLGLSGAESVGGKHYDPYKFVKPGVYSTLGHITGKSLPFVPLSLLTGGMAGAAGLGEGAVSTIARGAGEQGLYELLFGKKGKKEVGKQALLGGLLSSVVPGAGVAKKELTQSLIGKFKPAEVIKAMEEMPQAAKGMMGAVSGSEKLKNLESYLSKFPDSPTAKKMRNLQNYVRSGGEDILSTMKSSQDSLRGSKQLEAENLIKSTTKGRSPGDTHAAIFKQIEKKYPSLENQQNYKNAIGEAQQALERGDIKRIDERAWKKFDEKVKKDIRPGSKADIADAEYLADVFRKRIKPSYETTKILPVEEETGLIGKDGKPLTRTTQQKTTIIKNKARDFAHLLEQRRQASGMEQQAFNRRSGQALVQIPQESVRRAAKAAKETIDKVIEDSTKKYPGLNKGFKEAHRLHGEAEQKFSKAIGTDRTQTEFKKQFDIKRLGGKADYEKFARAHLNKGQSSDEWLLSSLKGKGGEGLNTSDKNLLTSHLLGDNSDPKILVKNYDKLSDFQKEHFISGRAKKSIEKIKKFEDVIQQRHKAGYKHAEDITQDISWKRLVKKLSGKEGEIRLKKYSPSLRKDIKQMLKLQKSYPNILDWKTSRPTSKIGDWVKKGGVSGGLVASLLGHPVVGGAGAIAGIAAPKAFRKGAEKLLMSKYLENILTGRKVPTTQLGHMAKIAGQGLLSYLTGNQ